MSQENSRQQDNSSSETDDLRNARAEMRKQQSHETEIRLARVRAEYEAPGDERRARSAQLRKLRMLKEARDSASNSR